MYTYVKFLRASYTKCQTTITVLNHYVATNAHNDVSSTHVRGNVLFASVKSIVKFTKPRHFQIGQKKIRYSIKSYLSFQDLRPILRH